MCKCATLVLLFVLLIFLEVVSRPSYESLVSYSLLLTEADRHSESHPVDDVDSRPSSPPKPPSQLSIQAEHGTPAQVSPLLFDREINSSRMEIDPLQNTNFDDLESLVSGSSDGTQLMGGDRILSADDIMLCYWRINVSAGMIGSFGDFQKSMDIHIEWNCHILGLLALYVSVAFRCIHISRRMHSGLF